MFKFSPVREGSYTKLETNINNIMKTESLTNGFTSGTVVRNSKFYDAVANLVERCNDGILKKFTMSVNRFGEIFLYNFVFV